MAKRLLQQIGGSYHPYQFGFQRNRSTDDAWTYVQTCVCQSAKKYVLGVFVDFKGAFDNIGWCAILRRLEQIGSSEMALWRSYFCNRSVSLFGATEVVRHEMQRGCPQGSICGPYIWNVLMDELLSSLEGKFCAYADDLLLIVEGDSSTEIEETARRKIMSVSTWGDKVSVEISRDKTEMMHLKEN